MIIKSIIDEYRELTEDIAVIKSCITSTERDIKNTINTYQPKELGAIDYNKPTVQTSCSQESLSVVYTRLHDLETELQNLKNELQSLYQQRDELEKVINGLGDVEKKVMMLRIKGYPNWKIAKEMNYSQRWIEKIFKKIREKQKEDGESSV